MTGPVVVIAPGVHHAVHADGNVVNDAVEDHLPVNVEQRLVNAVVVVGPLHIVVGPDGKAHLAVPLRNSHYLMNLRRDGVLDELMEELIGVEHVPRAGVVNLQMQVRGRGVARIATEGDELSLTDRYVKRRQVCISLAGLVLVLITAQRRLDTW